MAPDVWEYRDDLENLARILCRHAEDAEDVAHAALIKAAEKLDGFRGEASVRTWLHTIATNECRMLRRRKAPGSIDSYLNDVVEDVAIEPAPDPEDLAMELETRREVMDGLMTLPDNYRCALLLKEGQGLTIEQTAGMMATTPAALRSVLYRARKELRAKVKA